MWLVIKGAIVGSEERALELARLVERSPVVLELLVGPGRSHVRSAAQRAHDVGGAILRELPLGVPRDLELEGVHPESLVEGEGRAGPRAVRAFRMPHGKGVRAPERLLGRAGSSGGYEKGKDRRPDCECMAPPHERGQ